MNRTQKRLSILGLTVLLILFASVSLYGQNTYYRYVFYLDSVPKLHMLYAPVGGCCWKDQNEGNSAYPASGSALTMVNHGGGVQLFYIDANHQIWEILEVEPSSWITKNVSGATGAPAAVAGSALTGFFDASGVFTHVFYEGTNGHLYELYGDSQQVWHFDDPTSLARGAPVAASGSALTSFIDGGVMHVFYLGTNNNVYELYWTGGTAWHSDDPTSLAGAPAAGSVGSLTSFVGSGVMHVFYLSSQNVHELYWNGVWHTDDPTSLAGAPVDAPGSALTSFVNTSGSGDTGMHVMYLGTNEHVYALHSVPAWGYFDATAASGGVPAASGSHLASFQDTVTGGVRLYFIATNSHVYELYWPSEGAASETDLTVASGAGATAAMGSALAALGGLAMPFAP